MNVNLLAPLRLIKGLAPTMKRNGGKIVNISSIWGVRSKEYRTLYSMTKFGLIGQTKALARELGQYNVLVNAVCPGFTDTDLTRASLTPEALDAIVHEIPLGRLACPEEIAKLVKFLIGDDNTYITGQSFVIDGGFLA
jgi:3-oxoacyl-[acyl-carrier protein] reductase